MKNIILLFVFCSLISCHSSVDMIPGLYVKQNNYNLIDTIKIFNNGSYERFIYSRNKILVFHNKSNWDYEGCRLTLHDFFKDEDEIFYDEKNPSTETRKYDKFLLNVSLPLENGSLYINRDMNIFYEKLDF